MRELSQDTPTLFDPPPPATVVHAKDFVRWCCSFGADFRNSPDVANLRYWAHKKKIQIRQGDEGEILDAARMAFLKRIEFQLKRLNGGAAACSSEAFGSSQSAQNRKPA